MNGPTILLCSAGRRAYLVGWFTAAMAASRRPGRVLVADCDPWCPGQAVADGFWLAPRVDDPSYDGWLAATLADQAVSAAFSVNDFELSHWAKLPESPGQADRWSALVRLPARLQGVVEDKAQMAGHLAAHGIPVPATLSATADREALAALARQAGTVVVKGRYGSGSRGLAVTDSAGLAHAVEAALPAVTRPDGTPPSSPDEARGLVVVQACVQGQEYGLDVVCDWQGGYAGVLARRKLAMRHGETDRAVSTDPAPFADLARQLAQAVPHRGPIDVDLIVDGAGTAWVIDVNPRFGGGYPFSHLAGADLPRACVDWVAGLPGDPACLVATPGVVGAKAVEVRAVATGQEDAHA